METAPANTMMTEAPAQKADGLQEYFYPEQGVTVRAASQADADAALAKITSEATMKI